MLKIDRRVFIAGVRSDCPDAFSRRLGASDGERRGPACAGRARRKGARARERSRHRRRICLDELPALRAFRRHDFRRFPPPLYIDSGKVRYIFREFPLNAPAYAVAMVARCAPADRFFEIIHTYFRSQEKWLSSQDLRGAILEMAKPFGFTEQSFEACLSNQALFEGLENVRSRGAEFGVQATPTFFINGRKMEGALSLDDLQKAIDPLL